MMPSPEFLILSVGISTAAAVAFYMAARRNSVAKEFAFIVTEVVREYEPDEGTMDGSQLTFEDAIANRNEVLDDLADKHSGWLAIAAAEMARLEPGVTGIGEDFKRLLLERGVPPPKHHNVWGGFTATMVRRKVIAPTGEYRAMRGERANARKSPVYVRIRSEAA